MVPHRPKAGSHLEPARLTQLIASLASGSPLRLRNQAITSCTARLRLRACEVPQLQLDDLDGGNATVRGAVARHWARCAAVADRRGGQRAGHNRGRGRPETSARQGFVLHRLPRQYPNPVSARDPAILQRRSSYLRGRTTIVAADERDRHC